MKTVGGLMTFGCDLTAAAAAAAAVDTSREIACAIS